jgi:chromatin remodeling complex protein RSC6
MDPTTNEFTEFSEEDFCKLPSTISKIIRRTNTLIDQTEKLRKSAIEANNELKAVQLLTVRYAKKMLKDINKKETLDPESTKGFRRRSYNVSDAMKEFLGDDGTDNTRIYSRGEVNKYIHEYIKEKNLFENKYIQPDTKLWSILSEQALGKRITYFSLQKYIKHHFTSVKYEAST